MDLFSVLVGMVLGILLLYLPKIIKLVLKKKKPPPLKVTDKPVPFITIPGGSGIKKAKDDDTKKEDGGKKKVVEQTSGSPKQTKRKKEKRKTMSDIRKLKSDGSKAQKRKFSAKELDKKDVLEKLEKQLISELKAMVSSRYLTNKGANCFKGSYVVDWLMKNVDFSSRPEAVAFGTRLWAKGLIESVDSSWRPFYDNANEYVFVNQTKVRKQLEKKSSVVQDYFQKRNERLTVLRAAGKEGWLGVKEQKKNSSGKLKKPRWINRWLVLQTIEEPEEKGGKKKKKEKGDEGEEAEELSEKKKRKKSKKPKTSRRKHWELVAFASMLNTEDSKLVAEMIDSKTGISFGKKQKLKSKQKKIFKGKKAVEWLIENKKSKDEREALLLMNSLMEKNIIIPTVGTLKDMGDVEHFIGTKDASYRFVDSCFAEEEKRTIVARITLADCDLSMDEEGDHVLLMLQKQASGPMTSFDTLDDKPLDSKAVVMRVRKQDEQYLQDWIVALNTAVIEEGAADVLAEGFEETLIEGQNGDSDNDVAELKKYRKKKRSKKKRRKSRRAKGEDNGTTEEESEPGGAYEDDLLKAEMLKVEEMRRELENEKKQAELDGIMYGVPANYPDLRFDWAALPTEILLKCLRARRLEIPRAVRLMKMCVPFRVTKKFDDTRISHCTRQIPNLGMLVLNGRDIDGRPLVFLKAKNYLPKKMPADECVRSMLYLFDIASEEFEEKVLVQRIGITCIADCAGAGLWKNFDPKAVPTLVNGILGHYPIRIGHIIVMNPPRVFNMVWRVVKPLLPPDVVKKVHILDKAEDVFEYIPRESLLKEMGGELEFDGDAFVASRFKIEGISQD